MERDKQFTVDSPQAKDTLLPRPDAVPSLRGYDVDLDIADFTDGRQNLPMLASRKKHDLETMLAERFDTELAITNYHIKNGRLYHSEFNEPFSQRIKMGIEYRKERNSPDQVRELAELEGFLKLEQQLQNAPAGTKFIVISPPGNQYPKNFFEIHEKVGKDNVRSSRYTSTLSNEQLLDVACNLDPVWQAAKIANPDTTPTDADFLRHPIKTSLPADKILEKFHPEKDTMRNSDYQKLKDASAPIIRIYLNQLQKNPDPGKVYTLFNALLNFADQYVKYPENRTASGNLLKIHSQSYIIELSQLPVRPTMAGCGLQTSYDTASGRAPYSVADYAPAQDRYGSREIHCDQCGANYNRTPGKLEEKCRLCGGTKGIVC